jgi:hypothetical protein
VGTDSTSFAVVQVRLKVALVSFRNSHIRAKNKADTAADAMFLVDHRSHGPPVAGFVPAGTTGIADDATYFKIFPGKFFL